MANRNTAARKMGCQAVERLIELVQLAHDRQRPDLVVLCARQVDLLDRTVRGRLSDPFVVELEHIRHLTRREPGE